MVEILENMGFIKLCEIKKERKVYLLAGLEISLDEVDGLGSFMEIEGMANGDAEYAEKKKEIFKLIDRFGVQLEEISQKSYIEMALQ